MGKVYKKITVIHLKEIYKQAKKHRDRGHYRRALRYLLKAHRALKKMKNNRLIHVAVLNNIGDCYHQLFNYRKAIDYFLLALKQNESILSMDLDYIINRNLANTYKDMNNNTKFIEYITKCTPLDIPIEQRAMLNLELGNAYRVIEEYDQAISCINEAIAYFKDNHCFELGYCLMNLAQVHLDLDNFIEALYYLERTEGIFNSNLVPLKYFIQLYYLFEVTCSQLGYHDTAIFYSSKNRKINV